MFSGYSSFGKKYFEDESFKWKHYSGGFLAMLNYDKDKNSSIFVISFRECFWLNNKNVVFGKVISGYNVRIQDGAFLILCWFFNQIIKIYKSDDFFRKLWRKRWGKPNLMSTRVQCRKFWSVIALGKRWRSLFMFLLMNLIINFL